MIAYPPSRTESDGVSTSELMSRLSDELSRLVRAEVELVRVEMLRTGKRAGFGFGALGGAGALAFYAGACLLAAAILALALVMPAWGAALLVGVVVLISAGVCALIGKKLVQHALPPGLPEETVENLRADVRTVKEHAKR